MFKKRAMAAGRQLGKSDWMDNMAIGWVSMKHLETGYADNQPKWPYWVRPYNYDEQEWYDIDKWLLNTMGQNNWLTENARWVGSDRKYWFRDEQDRTMFILRWS
jgi:hypothetical protein